MNILTFDIEEWHHNLIKGKIKDESYSVALQVVKLLNLFECHNIKPTFFIVAEFALNNKGLVKRIADKYDIGSHGLKHDLISGQSYKDFEKDVNTSLKILEDITQRKVTKYRAPGFSFPNTDYFKVLFDTQIETDCSLSARNHFYGKKIIDNDGYCLIEYNGRQIREFPPSVLKLCCKDVGFLGGGYFRLLPAFMLEKQIKRKNNNALFYLHANDFDVNQPKMTGLSLIENFRHNVGIQNAENKLLDIIKANNFADIQSAEEIIDWHNVPVIKL